MFVTPVTHLYYKDLMAQIEGLQPPSPSDDFRVTGIPFFVIGQNRPYWHGVLYVHPAGGCDTILRGKIPNSHILSLFYCLRSLFQVSQQGLSQLPDSPCRKDKLHILHCHTFKGLPANDPHMVFKHLEDEFMSREDPIL